MPIDADVKGGYGKSGNRPNAPSENKDTDKGGNNPLKDFDYRPTQTNYLGNQDFSQPHSETEQKYANDQLAKVIEANPTVFNLVEDPSVKIDSYGNQQIYDSATGNYVGSMGRVGDMYGLPGVGKYLGMAGSFFGVNADIPTFTVSPVFAKQSGLEREMGGGNGGDGEPSTMELLYPTEETLSEEEIAAAEDPTIGYALDYYDQIQPYNTFAAGGLASLPANFNPMTGVNPFRMMMRGGRI